MVELMPIDDQVLARLEALSRQITALHDSFSGQVRGLSDVVNATALTYGQKLTAIEHDLAAHIDLDAEKHRRFDELLKEHGEEIETLATQMGKDTAGLGHRIGKLEGVVAQVRTARKVIVGLVTALAGAAGWLLNHVLNH